MRTCHVLGAMGEWHGNQGPLVIHGGHHNRADVVSSPKPLYFVTAATTGATPPVARLSTAAMIASI